MIYPATLPPPSRWQERPPERRAVSPRADAPQAMRERARDRVMIAQATWVYSATQMQVWRGWYDNELLRRRLFAASLPGSGGYATRVARYLGPVRREFIAPDHWRVTAELELRGLSALPQLLDDPFFDDVVLLLGFDDQPDGGTTFTDDSPIGHTVTGVNGAVVDTDAPLVSVGSLLLNGTGARLDIASHSSFGFDTGVWTWEARGKLSSASGSDADNEPIYDFRTNQFEDGAMFITGASRQLAYWDGTTMSTGGSSVSIGALFDAAISYDGTTVRGFLGGVLQWSAVRALSFGTTNLLRIGDNFLTSDGADRFHGSLDEMRVTRRCRYTANYTPVAGKFPRQ